MYERQVPKKEIFTFHLDNNPKINKYIHCRHYECEHAGADPGFCEGGFKGGFVDSLKGTFEQK